MKSLLNHELSFVAGGVDEASVAPATVEVEVVILPVVDEAASSPWYSRAYDNWCPSKSTVGWTVGGLAALGGAFYVGTKFGH